MERHRQTQSRNAPGRRENDNYGGTQPALGAKPGLTRLYLLPSPPGPTFVHQGGSAGAGKPGGADGRGQLPQTADLHAMYRGEQPDGRRDRRAHVPRTTQTDAQLSTAFPSAKDGSRKFWTGAAGPGEKTGDRENRPGRTHAAERSRLVAWTRSASVTWRRVPEANDRFRGATPWGRARGKGYTHRRV